MGLFLPRPFQCEPSGSTVNQRHPLVSGLKLWNGRWLGQESKYATIEPPSQWTASGLSGDRCYNNGRGTGYFSGALGTAPAIMSTSFTMCVWMNTTETGGVWDDGYLMLGWTNYRDIVSIKRTSYNNYASVLLSQAYVTTTAEATTGVINNGRWHHIAAVLRGADIEIYTDGTLVKTHTHAITIAANGTAWAVAREGPAALPMMWDRALSASEIRLLYTDPYGILSR